MTINTAFERAAKLADEYLQKRTLSMTELNRVEAPTLLLPPDSLYYERYGFSKYLSKGRFGLFIPYMTPNGDQWISEDKPYGVIRFLGEPNPLSVRKDEHVPKVLSPLNRLGCLHFAPIRDGRAWNALPPGTVILHCESAVKAEAMTKATGLPAVGYNGVNGYSSNKLGIQLIHQFAEFAWNHMVHVILFDSDVVTNPMVKLARDKLCHKMRHILACPDVRQATIPIREDGTNRGPDDYLVEEGPMRLMAIIDDAVGYQDEEYSSLVEEMNSKIRWVTTTRQVYDRKLKDFLPVRDAANHYANVNLDVLNANGRRKERVYGLKVWMDSTNRGEVDVPGYEYMGPEFFEQDGQVCANTYRFGGASPAGEGSWDYKGPGTGTGLGIIGVMLKRLFKEDDLELLRSYLRFGKYCGDKPTSYCVMHSHLRGVGKGWFTELARALLGPHNVGTTTADQLAEKFNSHTIGIRLLIAHEFKAASAAAKAAALNYLKSYVGDEVIPVRKMNTNVYSTRVKSLVIITTNDKSDIPSDGLGDRRGWYIEAGAGGESGEGGSELIAMDEYEWAKAWDALKNEVLMGRFAQWVLDGKEIDFKSWRPKLTAERQEDLVEGLNTMAQTAYDVRMDAIARGVICTTGAMIKLKMEEIMAGREVWTWPSGRAFGKIMNEAGWWSDAKRYKYDGATVWFPKPARGEFDLPPMIKDGIRLWGKKFD